MSTPDGLTAAATLVKYDNSYKPVCWAVHLFAACVYGCGEKAYEKQRACFKSSSATQIGWSFRHSCSRLLPSSAGLLSLNWTRSLPLWAHPWLTLPLPSLDRKANIHFVLSHPNQDIVKKSLESKELHNSSDFHQELTNGTLRDLGSNLTYLLAVWPFGKWLNLSLNPTFFK